MADARSLLRQQRAARRIEHPHAAYSDAGKLLCTTCHEHVKADSLWDAHIRSPGHRQRVQASKTSGAKPTETLTDEQLLAQALGQKRKHPVDEDGDDEMLDDGQEEAIRKKRSRQDIASTASTGHPSPEGNGARIDSDAESGKTLAAQSSKLTPPGLTRRVSGTPVHGVEMQIPSRPATPNAPSGAATSATSTPKVTPVGRSPLIPQDHHNQSTSITAGESTRPPTRLATTAGADEDDDWAAFEAEVVNTAPAGATASAYSADAVISAAPMTADEIAQRSQEEERAKRRAAADIEIEDEKEEASRALETEFEEMEELEARVKRLKEKREALRSQGSGSITAVSTASAPAKQIEGKENGAGALEDEDDDEEEEEDDEDDDWNSFRFRA
ncbi:putative zinc finger protein 830-like protein [Phaeoacremonium minimum UCRPA7]|uniref:Putative zinc finger protein 830-like protein n=1 Tax=Phaeoacremonium minimum (strain UCR-PA7) TaxID=1286976 RepID=R8BLY6_PHAM7|nr:putative zinc finger protein 830-like protein [Phaeoacremonium minimum UCRPA7]EOO00378.1 putative zinc finger protein 830-like protein [Phaeoacremonium minimum UCRPA7]